MDGFDVLGELFRPLVVLLFSAVRLKNADFGCLNGFQDASSKLEQQLLTVEDFVEHLIYLAKLSAEVPVMETEYTMITKLYTIAKDFDVYVPPEDLALYQILPPSFQHLKVCAAFKLIADEMQTQAAALQSSITTSDQNKILNGKCM
jgi:hypothetical protein